MNAAVTAYAEGNFSVLDSSPFTVEAEPGLVIHVHAGRLWVQQDGAPTLDVTAGERLVLPGAGSLSVRGAACTHIELQCAGAAALRA